MAKTKGLGFVCSGFVCSSFVCSGFVCSSPLVGYQLNPGQRGAERPTVP